LDDVGVGAVSIWRDLVNGDPTGAVAPDGSMKIFVGNATFVVGARPDIAAVYPSYVDANRAGWGYMLLTNVLPNVGGGAPVGGVGTFTLYAYAVDLNGNVTALGSRTIGCDNTQATRPFGTIDTPPQGGTVSGTIQKIGRASCRERG